MVEGRGEVPSEFKKDFAKDSKLKKLQSLILALGLAVSSVPGRSETAPPQSDAPVTASDKAGEETPDFMDGTAELIDEHFESQQCLDERLVAKKAFETEAYRWMLKNRFGGKSQPEFPKLTENEANRELIFRLAKEISREYKVDPYLILGLIAVESQFEPKAVSTKGAAGLTQIMPNTFRGAGFNLPAEIDEGYYWEKHLRKKGHPGPKSKLVLKKELIDPTKDGRFDPETSIKASLKLLEEVRAALKGNVSQDNVSKEEELVLLGYSMGAAKLGGYLKRNSANTLLNLYTKIKANPKNKTDFLYYPLMVKFLSKFIKDKYPDLV